MAAFATALPLVLASCAQPPAVTVRGAGPAVVSLNPCADAILVEVADESQILALSHFSQEPSSSSMDVARARGFRGVSGSAEEVLALRPDVVLTDSFMPGTTRRALEKGGVRLVKLPIARTVAESQAQIAQVAGLAGHPERGAALNARIDAALERVAAPSGAAALPAVVWQSGGIVPGEETLISELLARTGFGNFAAGRGMRQADLLSLESMLANPPRVIFAAGNPASNEDRMLSHPALGALDATAREPFPTALLWCGGPSILRTAERLSAVRRRLAERPPGP